MLALYLNHSLPYLPPTPSMPTSQIYGLLFLLKVTYVLQNIKYIYLYT